MLVTYNLGKIGGTKEKDVRAIRVVEMRYRSVKIDK